MTTDAPQLGKGPDQEPSWQRPLMVALVLALLGVSGLALGPFIPEKIAKVISDVAIVFFVIGAIHLLDHFAVHQRFLRSVAMAMDSRLEELRPEVRAAAKEGIEDIRADLKTDIARAVEQSSRKAIDLLDQVDQCDITAVYSNRKAALKHIETSVNETKQTLLVLAVALTEGVGYEFIKAKAKAMLSTSHGSPTGNSVRILLMDPLRSPALFRMIMEEKPEAIRRMLDHDRTVPDDDDPYCDFELYHRVYAAAINFQGNEGLGTSEHLRFYRHAPSFWLCITDSEVFCQPYILGVRDQSRAVEPCSGDILPVFRYRAGRVSAYLRQHFETLWNTTQADLQDLLARNADRGKYVKELLDSRGDWVRYAFDEVTTRRERKRATIHHPCAAGVNVSVEISSAEGSSPSSAVSAVLNDHSDGGIGLWVLEDEVKLLPDKARVCVKSLAGATPAATLSRRTQSILSKRLPRTAQAAVVVRPPDRRVIVKDGRMLVGLRFDRIDAPAT